MTLLYSKIKDENTKEYEVINQEEAKKLGWEQNDLEFGWDGKFYLSGYVPQKSIEEQNEQIRQQRQSRYVLESDPLRLDYDEALAREQDNAEELKQEWLASKDKIREELPYIVEG